MPQLPECADTRIGKSFYASLTGTWRTEYPFDPSYFFIGAGTLCLAALGILGKQAGTYVRRFFMFGIAAPLFFAGVFLFHASGLMKQLSIDPWKPMIVFVFVYLWLRHTAAGF